MPTGCFLALMTMRSSMLRSLKMARASEAREESLMQIGLGVITSARVRLRMEVSVAMWRRRSPSVKTPASLPRLFTMLRLPALARVMMKRASLTEIFSEATGLRSPVRMMSPTRRRRARPIEPEG